MFFAGIVAGVFIGFILGIFTMSILFVSHDTYDEENTTHESTQGEEKDKEEDKNEF